MPTTPHESCEDAIGFIGLGNMGWPMAANLARAGRRLVVHDRDVPRARAFAEEFQVEAADGATSFSTADALITMLPTGTVVRESLVEDGIAAVLRRGALVIDTSSSDPVGTKRLGAELRAHGLTLVDAPVSGGRVRALDATLAIMLGADEESAARQAEDVLAPVSARIFRTGGLGTGHAMKALNNYVLAAGFVASCEALIIGGRFGLPAQVMLDVLNASSGRNLSTETTLVDEVLTRRFSANFALGLFTKDLGIAADLVAAVDADAPACQTIHRRMAEAMEDLGAQADYTAVVPLWEARTRSAD